MKYKKKKKKKKKEDHNKLKHTTKEERIKSGIRKWET